MPAKAKYLPPYLSARALALPALAALLLMTACSGESVTDPGSKVTGQFNATVSGAVQSSLSGTAAVVPVAASVVDSVQVPASAILGLIDTQSQALVAFQWSGSSTVAPGTYTVGEGSGDLAMVYETGTGAAGSTYDGTAGSIVVKTVTDGVASGTFTVTATAHDTGAQVTVSGTFDAPTITPSTSS